MRFRYMSTALLSTVLLMPGLQAQNGATQSSPTEGVGDQFTAEFMAQHVPELLEKAKTTADGTATLVMKRYPGNYLNLMVRVKTGIGELHANWSDILVCIDGEADVITGGTLVDRKDQA